jgi:hypothetical protein
MKLFTAPCTCTGRFKTCTLLLLLALRGFAQAPDPLEVRCNKGFTLISGEDATGASPAYTWYENQQDMGDGYRTASINIPAGAKAPGTYTYVRWATDATCPAGVPSNTYTVVVRACCLPVSAGEVTTAGIQTGYWGCPLVSAGEVTTASIQTGYWGCPLVSAGEVTTNIININ